jgi:hypothetical protein
MGAAMPKFINLVGHKYGHWNVIELWPERVRYGRSVNVCWVCSCDCGIQRILTTGNLRWRGSCGCFRRERTIERFTKHGHARVGKHTRAYRAWHNMLQRCFNPNSTAYRYYGGRGILSITHNLSGLGSATDWLNLESKESLVIPC